MQRFRGRRGCQGARARAGAAEGQRWQTRAGGRLPVAMRRLRTMRAGHARGPVAWPVCRWQPPHELGGLHEQDEDAPHVRPAITRQEAAHVEGGGARAQDVAVALIVDTMAKELAARPRTLFVVGSYRIGKERAYLGAARAMRWKVFCTPDKRKARAARASAARAGSMLAGLLHSRRFCHHPVSKRVPKAHASAYRLADAPTALASHGIG